MYIHYTLSLFSIKGYRRGGFSLSTFCEVSSYPFPSALTAFCLSSIAAERVDDSFLASSLNFPRDSCRMLLFAFHSSLPVPVQLPAKYKSRLRVLGRLCRSSHGCLMVSVIGLFSFSSLVYVQFVLRECKHRERERERLPYYCTTLHRVINKCMKRGLVGRVSS